MNSNINPHDYFTKLPQLYQGIVYASFSLQCYFMSVIAWYQYRNGKQFTNNLTSEEKFNISSNWITFAGSAAIFLFLLTEVIYVTTHWPPLPARIVVFVIENNIAFMLVFLAFWSRQRLFYQNESLQHLTNRYSRFTSLVIFPAYLTVTVCLLIATFINVFLNLDYTILMYIVPQLLLCVVIILFIMPLVKSRNMQVLSATDKIQLTLIRRGLICFSCVFTMAFLYVVVLFHVAVFLPMNALCQCSCTLLLVALFGDWKKRLFPFL